MVSASLPPVFCSCITIVPSGRNECLFAKKRMSLREETNVPSGRDENCALLAIAGMYAENEPHLMKNGAEQPLGAMRKGQFRCCTSVLKVQR